MLTTNGKIGGETLLSSLIFNVYNLKTYKTMGKNTCIVAPEINGKRSKMYVELLKKFKIQRNQANFIYCVYEANPNMGKKMDSMGYKRNDQGQHNAKDILDFIEYKKWKEETNDISALKVQYGITDYNDNDIEYDNAKDALEKAKAFNDDMKGYVATVVAHSDPNRDTVYNILVYGKSGNNILYANNVEAKLQIWDEYKKAFSSIGVDLDNVPLELKDRISPMNTDLVQSLINLKKFTLISGLMKKDALTLFYLNQNSRQVQRLVNAFGSIEKAADALSAFNAKTGNLSSSEKVLLVNAVNYCKQFNGIDLVALKKKVSGLDNQLNISSPENEIVNTLHKLNKKYGIDRQEIHATLDNIKKLSQATANAALNLERQIREIKVKEGKDSAEAMRLEAILDNLTRELKAERYCHGIMDFLVEAQSQIADIDTILKATQQPGNTLEQLFSKAKGLYQISLLRKKYYDIVNILADKHLDVDESISQVDIDNFRNAAEEVRNIFDKNEKKVKELTLEVVSGIMLNVVGNDENAISLVNSIGVAAVDSTVWDGLLYTLSRASNPVMAIMGGIINKAKVGRNELMNDFDTRITKATKKLYASGSNTEFMYEDDGHIISDIDWKAFYSERKKVYKEYKEQGLNGFELRKAMLDWEDVNTVDRVVDITNGRTERVPNDNYSKPFPQLTAAQREYYDTIMQIKGEIGSLLPAYAQNIYLPPQLRRNTVDALTHAKGIGDVIKAIKNKAMNFYTIREDDEGYSRNGIIDDMKVNFSQSSFDDTPLRAIPIFFVNRVEQGELLKDFSAGINALAGTAINYNAMSQIEDVVNFIGDFIKDQAGVDENKKVDVVDNGVIRIFKDLRKFSQKNVLSSAIVDGFINKEIYGMEKQGSNGGNRWDKIVGNLISYTSFKQLATNVKGMVQNYLMGEFQMLIESGAGEFYNRKEFFRAHAILTGTMTTSGELWDLINDTKNSKAVLLREMFDPEQENFKGKMHKRYHKSMLRRFMSHDMSFIGYGTGEYVIHMIGMYGCLLHKKVLVNGKETTLYDAFEVIDKGNGAGVLALKAGTTKLDGSPITRKDLEEVAGNIKYVNQTCHGAMNDDDKGLITQFWLGRLTMNFRQWMIEHYSRRFRGRHWDGTINQTREGYYRSLWRAFIEEYKEGREENSPIRMIFRLMGECASFAVTGRMMWANLDKVQKYNLCRAHNELILYFALLGLGFALGEPKDNRGNAAKKFWIYQVKRLILDTEASTPHPAMLQNMFTILQSPMAGVSMLNNLLYIIYGLTNGDVTKKVDRGKNKGENKYLYNVKKKALPFFKDYYELRDLGTRDDIFAAFKIGPSGY